MRLTLCAVAATLCLALPAHAQDPLAPMGAAISAVLDLTSAPRVMLVEEEHGVANSRTLAVGDEYRAGWRITGVDARKVTLTKGKDRREVELPERVRAALAAVSEDVELPPAGGVVTTSNARFARAAPDLSPSGGEPSSMSREEMMASLRQAQALEAEMPAIDRIPDLVAKAALIDGRPGLPGFMAQFADGSDGASYQITLLNGSTPAIVKTVGDRPSMILALDFSAALNLQGVMGPSPIVPPSQPPHASPD